MITLKTITTIELTNLCNLKCRYCVNRLLVKHPARELGIMSDEVFERALFWLGILCRRGTQKEIWMNGLGESCLDPQLFERIRKAKDIMGDRQVGLCTNGVNMTYEMAKGLKDTGLDQLDISPHSAFHTRRAVSFIVKAGWGNTDSVINTGIFNGTHNWCDQLEPENQVETPLTDMGVICDPLVEGRGYIWKEGGLTPCCYDYRFLGKFGTVFDEDLLSKPIKPFKLCEKCHQRIPEKIIAEYNRENPDNPIYMIGGVNE